LNFELVARGLPAAAASPAISTIPVPAAASAAATPASATATASAASESAPAAPAPSAPAFAGWTSFIHDDVAAHEILTVESLDSALCFVVAIDLHKSESAWLTRETIAHQRYICGSHSGLSKKGADLFFRGLKRQIPDVKFLQRVTPSGRGKGNHGAGD